VGGEAERAVGIQVQKIFIHLESVGLCNVLHGSDGQTKIFCIQVAQC
jgi:hypothetical protein